MKLISPHTFLADANHRQLVIDVRTPAEYQGQCWKDSLNIPLQELQSGKLTAIPTAPGSITLLCQSGKRSQLAAELLQHRLGECEVCVVEGGITALSNAGAPLHVGNRGVWSLDRQVRITAGLLVLLGILLSVMHPYFLAISALVGAGLIFAGVTDSCGMAMLLARLPWNQK